MPISLSRSLVTILVMTSVQAMASESITWKPYVTASVEADDADSSQLLLEVGSLIGTAGWVRAGAGRATLANFEQDIDTDLLKLGGGFSVQAVDAAAGFVHRSDGDGFEQDDFTVSLGWQWTRGSIGADVFLRSAESETVASVRRRRQNAREIRLTESIDGTGYGLHADFDVTPALTVFAAWMTYDYDIATNHPVLARFSLLNGSGITRSEAFLDQSVSAGLTYHFLHAAVTAQYMHDEALVEHDVTDSVQVSVQILLGQHWSLTPMFGFSENDLIGNTAFGGLSIGYSW